MFRALMLTLVVLAACSSQPAAPVFGDDDERPRVVAPAPVAVPLSCAADAVRFCPTRGCTPEAPGELRQQAISITTPGPGLNVGRFCAGEDCRAAYFRNLRDRDGSLVAEIWTGESWSRPEGALDISPSRSRFHLSKPASDGSLVWSGSCQASGS